MVFRNATGSTNKKNRGKNERACLYRSIDARYDKDGHVQVLVLKYGKKAKLCYMDLCSCHVTYAFQSESTIYTCLNVKDLLARSRREI